MGQTHRDLAEGRPEVAVEELGKKARVEGKDQVLYMLDYAIALHEAGEYEQSNRVLIEADRLADTKDYVSLSRQAGSLLTNESMLEYKSERFENYLINAYLALNFAILGKYEDAVVECRRINEKLNKYKLEKGDKTKNFYSRYLSAVMWESQKEWDSAYIDYKKAYEINSSVSYLGEDLIRSAWRARRYDDLKKWQKQYPNLKLDLIKSDAKNKGELVFIYQQGWIPRKKPRPDNFRFPYLKPVHSGFTYAEVEVDGKRQSSTAYLYDVGQEAIRTLEADYAYLVAKKVAGIIAKEVVADQVRQKNEGLGNLLAIAMHVSDQADTRQWSTLPNSFQIFKQPLSPGKHEIKIYAKGPAGETLIYNAPVDIKKGKKTFITERTFY